MKKFLSVLLSFVLTFSTVAALPYSADATDVACTEHNYESVVTPPTCTEQGFTTYTCSLCGDTYTGDYVEATGHTPSEAVCENEVEADPSSFTNGFYDSVVYCYDCGEELSRITEKIPVSGSCGTNATYTFDSETGELIISGSGAIKSYSTTNQSPFYCKTQITKVVIGDEITSVGNYAFTGCSGIKELTMPCSASIVLSNNPNVFTNCSNIEKLTLTKGNGTMHNYGNDSSGNGNIYRYTPWYISSENLKEIILEEGITNIGDYAFNLCKEVTEINIPSSVKSIGEYSFWGCSGITGIEIPSGVSSIGQSAFSGCSNLAGSVVIPSGVTSISERAFYGCTALTEVELPSSLTSIGNSAFYNCSGLENIEIPCGVTSIGSSAFYNCSGISGELVLPSGLKSIAGATFYGCKNLTSVELPANLTSVGDNAFSGCTALTKVVIPGNQITSMGMNAFNGCNALTGVYISSVEAWCNTSFSSEKSNPLYFAHKLYVNGSLLESLTIPDSVTSIGKYAFSGCTSITSLEIPDSVTSIGKYAFSGCTGLTGSVVIPSGVKTVEEGTFKDCAGITSVVIPDSVTKTSDYAFYGCSGLKELTIPCSANIYNSTNTFYNCSAIEKITITKGSGTMQSFTNNNSNSDTRTDYRYTPWYKSRANIKEIILEEGITNIGSYAFYSCTGLTGIVIPESVTIIENYAFYGCSNLEGITIPSSVTEINTSAFNSCNALTDVYYSGFEYQWNEIAISSNNNPLINATKHYNYVPPCKVHTYEAVVTPPTCTEQGFTTYNCSVCGDSYIGDYVEAIGHNYETVITAPTCTKRGYTTYTCTACGDKYTGDYVEATGHTPAQETQEIIVPATCSAEGSYNEIICCSVCGAELSRETKSTDKLSHTPAEAVYENIVNATCTSAGSYDEVVYCSVCNTELSRETKSTDKLSHTPAEAVYENIVNATCTSAGSYDEVVYCSVCHTELSRETKSTDKLSHTPAEAVYENIVNATCTKAGSYDEVVYCSVCHTELSRTPVTGAVLDHTPSDKVIENYISASCTKAGSYDEVVYCSVCHTELSREEKTIEKLEHTVVYDEEVPATCTETGKTQGSHCSVCGEIITAQSIIPATGHRYSYSVTSPTCTEQGFTTYNCSVCGDSYIGDYVEAIGHNYETVVTAPTCTEQGFTTYTCTLCEDTYVSDYVEPTNHSFGEWEYNAETRTHSRTCLNGCGETQSASCSFNSGEIRKAPSCIKEGEKLFTCTVCGGTYTQAIAKTPHNYSAVVTAPTCTENGFTTYTCTVCGDSYVDDETEATGHSFGEWEYSFETRTHTRSCSNGCGETQTADCSFESEITVQPSCTQKGEKTYTCTVCSGIYTEDIQKLSHTIVVDEAKAATCSETGLTQGSHCSACGEVIAAQRPTPLAEHRWDDGVVIQEASYDEEGIIKYTCQNCSAVKTESIARIKRRGRFAASNVVSKAGREIVVEIFIEQNPGITSLSIDVAYPEGLTLKSVNDENLFENKLSKGKLTSNPIAISWYSGDSSNDSSTGLFATLTFEIDENMPAGEYEIEISCDPDNIFDNEFNNVPFDIEHGSVKVIDVIPGDVFMDGEIDMKDVVFLQQYINRWDVEVDSEAADVNRDGKINMKDLVLIQQYINGWDVVLQ